MPLNIVRNDITMMQVDAIVNAANTTLLGGGGVDGAIHEAAGPKLLEECRTLNGCRTGEAKITGGYNLPCRYVIHTPGPIWRDGLHGEHELLAGCYRNSLALAAQYQCETVAFPLISAGAYGYPKDQALHTAVDTITEFLLEHEMTVYIVVFGRRDFIVGGKLFSDIREYIDDRYAESHYSENDMARRACGGRLIVPTDAQMCRASVPCVPWDDVLETMDESFAQTLIRRIDERNMTDAECYKRANVDRRLFNKIKNNPEYRPSKQTVLAFAIALRLDLDETSDMLMKAGFALSHSSKADLILEYCIRHGCWDINEINQVLFSYDLQLLGC